MIVSQVVRDAVKRGADYLDNHYQHPSWRRKCEGFQMWSPYSCIFGKLFGTIMEGAKLLSLNIKDLERLGFERYDDHPYQEYQQAWEDEFANPPLGTDDDPPATVDVGFDHIGEFSR
jgi:hypothetical protein